MKSLVLSAVALFATAGLAFGGECSLGGTGCVNHCPLAQEANAHRSTGEEAVFASEKARRELVRALVSNLSSL